jgi:hypothetical protein
MRTLVRDLLTLSRTGTTEMKVRTVSLDVCVDRVLETLDLRISETRAVITRDPLPDVSATRRCSRSCSRIWLSNALKFVAPGADAAHPHLRRAGPDDTWVIGVRDEGIGIDPERAHEIFRPFRRLHSTTSIRAPASASRSRARRSTGTADGSGWNRRRASGCHFRFTLGAPRGGRRERSHAEHRRTAASRVAARAARRRRRGRSVPGAPALANDGTKADLLVIDDGDAALDYLLHKAAASTRRRAPTSSCSI